MRVNCKVGFCLEVRGSLACFTRPEFKVDRVSYDVITPSAARAVLDAIMRHPAIHWRPTYIEVMNHILCTSFFCNAVGHVGSLNGPGFAVEDHHQPRHNLVLKDVRYRIHAVFDLTEKAAEEGMPDEVSAKYASMFERRARQGQCYHNPYFGLKEFPCDFRLVDREEKVGDRPINVTKDLGIMFYDWDYEASGGPAQTWFRARLVDGRMDIPHPDGKEVLR